MRTERPARLWAALTIAALAVAACGSGTTGSAAPAVSTAPTSATPVATPAPASEAPASEPAAGESAPAVAIPSFDLSQLGGAIPGLDSYRVSVSTEGTKQYESVVVTKPELAKSITTFKDDGTADSEYLLIGKEAWQSDGSGGWDPIPGALAQSLLVAFDPAVMFGAYANANWALGAGDKGVEDKNGIRARHFSIDPTVAIGAGMPAGTSVDLWVAEAGYLVALEIVSDAGSGLQVEVSNVNDPANVVKRPS